ncbi:hypothetical protein JF729_06915 [Mycobacterium intracellulare]|uniref:DUF7446 family protein n=1 Tax=Mycobacterium intracellulare TaxID=1767 RepID=UPI001CD98B2F|nr:hypothetical protein [Mycobacterium intracellulare]MCA2247527.1 hypothetical protein [Mycobacterium intracellulare]
MTYGIAYGPFSERIHIGRVNKNETEFVNKEDHTIRAALAVVEWVTKAHDGEVDLTPTDVNGPGYRITVERLTQSNRLGSAEP